MNSTYQKPNELLELAKEVEQLATALDNKVNVTFLFHVDLENNIVVHGTDVFYIAPDRMKEYLLIKKERFKLFLDAANQNITIFDFANRQNKLTLRAVECYDVEKMKKV